MRGFVAKSGMAIFFVLCFLAMDVSAAVSGQDAQPSADSATRAHDLSLPTPSVIEFDTAAASILDLAGNLTGLSSLGSTGPPIESHVLGLTLPPSLLPARYVADAAAKDRPLRHALLTWNGALGLQDEATLLADPELERADRLPTDVQVAVAALLYALTDATMLQEQAVAGLDADERDLLLSAPATLLAAGPDPQAWVDDPRIASISDVGTRVDMASIQAATRLVTATVSHVMPTLQTWSVAGRDPDEAVSGKADAIDDYLSAHSPQRLQSMHRIERLEALSEALLLAGDLMGEDVPDLAPIEPRPGMHLSEAIQDLAGTIEELHGVSVPVDELQLAQADLLPQGLQQAVARILLNHQAWIQTVQESNPGDQGGSVRSAAAAARLTHAVQTSAPTIEAFGLLYSHHAYATLPKTPTSMPHAVPGAVTTAQQLVNPDSPIRAVQAGFVAQGAEPYAITVAPLPLRGSLETAILDLYGRYGLDVDDAVRQQLHDDVMALPPTVERNAARLLMAQLDATDRLTELYQGLTAAEIDTVAHISPVQVQNRILQGEVPLSDLARIEVYYDIMDRVRDGYYDASLSLSATMDATHEALQDYGPKDMSMDHAPTWSRPVLATLNAIMPGAQAQGQGPQGDVLFSDPLLGAVVVGGFGPTQYDASMTLVQSIEMPYRAPLLSLDLGGDDRYRNNAGGSMLTFQSASDFGRVVVDPTAVAVALDLGGDDSYERPEWGSGFPPGTPPPFQDVIQGSSAGGIGILWDVDGHDRYEGNDLAQGSASGSMIQDRPDGLDCHADAARSTAFCLTGLMGVGILIDSAGDDQYVAHDRSQGAAAPLHGPWIEGAVSGSRPMAPLGGVGILIDAQGSDTYTLDRSATGSGQAFGDGGVGFLIDGDGDDMYHHGRQGQGTNGGLGVLVDLEGGDDYTRRNVHTNARFDDGACRVTIDPGAATAGGAPGFGLFADVRANGCRLDPLHTLSDLPEVDVLGLPAELVATSEQLLLDAQDTVFGLLNPEDTDGDGWSDGVEDTLLWNASDSKDSPGGLPLLPEDRPTQWPQGVVYPPESGLFPVRSDYILRIPGLLGLGDSTPTMYPDSPETIVGGLPAWEYLVTLDLGGNDTYRNRVGGPVVTTPVTGNPTIDPLVADTMAQNVAGLPALAVDFGTEDDLYDQGRKSCVQGCGNAILIDLAGNDTYHAYSNAQGATGSVASVVAVLFDGAGGDNYTTANGQGHATAKGSVALFLDALGDDTYDSSTQGVADSRTTAQSTFDTDRFAANAGLFMDLQGTDRYQPVGSQGVATSLDVQLTTAHSVAAFVEGGGHDVYLGTPTHRQGPDASGHRNDRLELDYRPSAPTHSTGANIPFTTIPNPIGQPNPAVQSVSMLFWDRDPYGGGVQSEPSPHLDIPGLGVAIANDCTVVDTVVDCNDVWDQDYALLIDPGGDDVYRNNAGGTLLRTAVGTTSASHAGPISVASLLIDLEGADHYDGGEVRVRSEFDVAGVDDAIQGWDPTVVLERPVRSGILVQGAGFLGVGMLVDDGGNDLYEARGFSQGYALLGSGVLWDTEGDDTYQARRDVVRNPVIAGQGKGYMAWEQLGPWSLDDPTALTWRPVVASIGTCEDFNLFGFDESSTGGWGPVRDLSLSPDGSTVLMSRLDEQKGLWEARFASVDEGNCTDYENDPFEIKDPEALAEDVGSNQLHPIWAPPGTLDRFAGTDGPTYIWQDDRNGEWDLYWNIGPNDNQDRDSLVIPGSDQTRPFVHDDTLVFEDDRHGPTSIYAIDLISGNQALLSADPDTGVRIQGEHTRPVVSTALVAWQFRADDDSPWRIAVLNRLQGDNGTLRILDPADMQATGIPVSEDEDTEPSEQTEPQVSGDRVVFTHTVPGQPPMAVSYDWVDDEYAEQATDASSITIHPTNPVVMAWIDTAGSFAAPTADSPPWEIHWQRDDRTIRPTDMFSGGFGMQMQGASWQTGLGLLLDVGGTDRYEARAWAQGAAFSRGEVESQFPVTPLTGGNGITFPGTRGPAMHSAHAMLIDLDGNDKYRASANSQGAHVGGSFVAWSSTRPACDPTGVVGCQPNIGQLVEEAENAAILFDAKGSDRYDASQASQGISYLVVAARHLEPDRNMFANTDQGDDPDGLATINVHALPSVGGLLDLGGSDGYQYGQDGRLNKNSLDVPDCSGVETAVGELLGEADPVQPLRELLSASNPVLESWNRSSDAVWSTLNQTVHERADGSVGLKPEDWELVHENITYFNEMIKWWGESDWHPKGAETSRPPLPSAGLGSLSPYETWDYHYPIETSGNRFTILGVQPSGVGLSLVSSGGGLALNAFSDVWMGDTYDAAYGTAHGPIDTVSGVAGEGHGDFHEVEGEVSPSMYERMQEFDAFGRETLVAEEGSGGGPPPAWSDVQQRWKELDADITVMLQDDSIASVFRTDPLPEIRDILGDALETPAFVTATCNDIMDAAGVDLASLSVQDAEGRNNHAWTQRLRDGDSSITLPSISANGDPLGVTSAGASPFAVNVGGVGVDMALVDQVEEQLEAQGVSDRLVSDVALEAKFKDADGDWVESDELRGRAQLVAEIIETDAQIDVRSVEFHIDGAFAGQARPADCRDGFDPDRWCMVWETDQDAFPDDNYTVDAVVRYGFTQVPGMTVGYVDRSQEFRIDNPPRLAFFDVLPKEFSPAPAPFATEPPSKPSFTFNISTDHPDPRASGALGAWIRIDVRNEAGDLVKVLHNFTDPPVPALEQSGVWDGTNHDGDVVPPGKYRITLNASDDPGDPSRSNLQTARVEVHSQPPSTGCVQARPMTQCNPGPNSIIPVGVYNAATVELGNGGSYQLTVATPDTGMETAHIFVSRHDGNDWGPWEKTTSIDLAGKTQAQWLLGMDHDRMARVMVLFEDRSGNVECTPVCGATHAHLNGDPAGWTLDNAVQNKADEEGFAVFYADFDLPTASVPDGSLVYVVDGQESSSQISFRLGPNRGVGIRLYGVEATSGLQSSIQWNAADDEGTVVSFDDPIQPRCENPSGGACPDNVYELFWTNWDGFLDAQEWPDGELSWQSEILDGVGNSASEFFGKLVFDATAPHLDETSTRIVYPDDGVTVNQTGDFVTVIVRVVEPAAVKDDVIDWGRMQVLLDASAITDASNTKGAHPAGWMKMSPGSDPTNPGVFSVSFPVGRNGLDLDLPGWREELPVHVADEARNWNESVVPILLGDSQIGLVGDAEFFVDHVDMSWSTSTPSRATLWIAEAGEDLEAFHSPLGTEHNFTLPSPDVPFTIHPATLYTYRIEAINETGLAQSAGPFTVPSPAGLDGAIETPADGAILSGTVPVVGSVVVSSDPGAELMVELRVKNASQPDDQGRLFMEDTIHGRPHYSMGDQVYIDVDGSEDVTPGDMRILAFGTGTIVEPDGFDVGLPFAGTALPGGYHFIDLDGDCIVDPEEAVLLTAGKASDGDVVAAKDLRLHGAAYGSQVTFDSAATGQPLAGIDLDGDGVCSGDADDAPSSLAVAATDQDGSGTVSLGDGIYVDADGDGHVSAGDTRLVASGGQEEGSVVKPDAQDVGDSLAIPVSGPVAFINMDGDQVIQKNLVTGALSDGNHTIEALITYRSPVGLEESLVVQVTDLVVDNSKPVLTADSPAPGAVLAGSLETIRIHATDAFTAIEADSAQLRVNGRLVEDATVTTVAQSDGGLSKTLEIGLPPGALPAGRVHLTATVRDLAGNPGVISYTVQNDPDAPAPQDPSRPAVEVHYPGGQQAARPEDLVRIRTHLGDASGIDEILLDASPVGGSSDMILQAGTNGHETAIRIGPATPSGLHALNLTATDTLGHQTTLQAFVQVDRETPALAASDEVPTSMQSARFGMAFTAPVEAWVTASQAGVLVTKSIAVPDDLSSFPDLAGATDVHGYAVELVGLEPGAEYLLTVEATGHAGQTVQREIIWRFAPVVVEPPSVPSLEAQAMRGAQVQLQWDVPEDYSDRSVRFLIHRAAPGQNFTHVGTSWTERFQDAPTPGSDYRYFVQAQNLQGVLGPASPLVQATVEESTSVLEMAVSPRTGPEGTPFTFTASVRSASTPDVEAWVVLEDTPYAMTVTSGDCRQECQITATVTPPVAFRKVEQRYHIEVADGLQLLRSPDQGDVAGPRVLLGDGTASSGNAEADGDAVVTPSLGPGTLLLVLAALALAKWRRRT